MPVPACAEQTSPHANIPQSCRGVCRQSPLPSATFGVLYKIPNTNASINLNFNQYKFLDELTPANNFVKNRQNLFFTVKF